MKTGTTGTAGGAAASGKVPSHSCTASRRLGAARYSASLLKSLCHDGYHRHAVAAQRSTTVWN